MTPIRVVVPGVPVQQGSKRIGRHGKRPVIIDDNDAELRPWRELVALHARRAIIRAGSSFERFDCAVEVEALFVIPRPRSHYGQGRNRDRVRPSAPVLPAVKPDLDKYARAALDALTDAAVWVDDGRVTDLHVRKRYAAGRPGLVITARPALELVEAVLP